MLTAYQESTYHGFRRIDFQFDGHNAVVIFPETPHPDRAWGWRAEFLGAFDGVDVELIRRGWHLVHYSLSDMFGCPEAVEQMKKFYDFVVPEFHLSPKCDIFGISRGGLYSFNFTCRYPQCVSTLYLDAPVLDMRDWPCDDRYAGSFDYLECPKKYHMTREQLFASKVHPVDRMEELLETGVPVLLIAGDSDQTVYYGRNGSRLANYLKEQGARILEIVKPGCDHHPHGLEDPTPGADFIAANRMTEWEETKMRIYAFADEANPQIDGQIAAMKRNGLDGLEIRGVDGTNVSEITVEKAREVREKLDAAGLKTWSIGSPLGKIDIEKDDFEVHMEKFRHTLEIAKILGAQNIRLFSFFIPKEQAPEQYRDEVIRRLKCFVEAAAGSGIDLCHENEKGIYGDVAARCLEIHQAVPELKAIFDPANYIQCGQDTLEAWNLLKPYVKYMHIKDALPDGSVVPAGKGTGHVAEILNQFQVCGGREVTIEPHLTVFAGLKDLEREGDTSNVGTYVYGSAEEAFDAACDALKALLV